MTREEALRIAKEFKELSEDFDSTEFVERDTEFFEYVIKELERTAPEVPVQEQLVECGSYYKENNYLAKKYMVTRNEDGTEYKELLEEISSLSVPTIEENIKEYKNRKKKITILCLLLYVVIITSFMYLCFKF